MRTRFVEAGGRRFEVLEAGEGDRLALCLHGFPEHAVSWRHQIPALAALGYRVWAVNQRGYGRSYRPDAVADYALPNLVDDVAALIDASGAASTVLIGHDWGGIVAWSVAATRARPLERLVILNAPHPVRFRAALRDRRQRRKSWYIGAFQIPLLPEWLLSRAPARAARAMFRPLVLPPEILAVYAGQLADRRTGRAMLGWYRAMRRAGPRALDLARPIEVPTLVIWGEDDVALDAICLDGTDRHVRDLRIERLPGVSHWVQQQAPERVNALLAAFLPAG